MESSVDDDYRVGGNTSEDEYLSCDEDDDELEEVISFRKPTNDNDEDTTEGACASKEPSAPKQKKEQKGKIYGRTLIRIERKEAGLVWKEVDENSQFIIDSLQQTNTLKKYYAFHLVAVSIVGYPQMMKAAHNIVSKAKTVSVQFLTEVFIAIDRLMNTFQASVVDKMSLFCTHCYGLDHDRRFCTLCEICQDPNHKKAKCPMKNK